MNVSTNVGRLATVVLSMVLFLSACDSRASRAEKAYNAYQAAASGGDLLAARAALQQLVAVNEDVPGYWVELGKVQLQLRDLNQAYYAFTRASELNRADPDVLRYLTQIALQAGELESAEERAQQLELLVPGDPTVKMTTGLIALRRKNFEAAMQQADLLLVNAPTDSSAKILKARALAGMGKEEAAIALLEQQVAQQPQDEASLRALINFRRGRGEWAEAARLGQKYVAIQPKDVATALLTIDAALRTADLAAARTISLRLLTPEAPADQVDAVLTTWRERWQGPESLTIARQLGTTAGARQRNVYARYLSQSGDPTTAARIVRDSATAAPTPANTDARAIYFDALARLGRRDEARAGLQAVLASDSDNAIALAALAPLTLTYGDKRLALNLARKLVTIDPARVDSRLILAHCFDASGDRDAARRTLWDAFHDLPGQDRIYTALRASLGPGSEEAKRLDGEYADQMQSKLMQEQV